MRIKLKMTKSEVYKLLKERQALKGSKRAAITRKLRKQAYDWCDANFYTGYTYCRGCALQKAIEIADAKS